jgi:hypothetical protein
MTKPQTTDGEQLSENHPYNQIWDAVKYRHTYTRTMFQHDIDQLMVQRDQQRLAAVLEALPKSIRIRSSPKTEDQKMRAMWDRGHNNVLDECRAAVTAALAPDTTNGVEEKK